MTRTRRRLDGRASALGALVAALVLAGCPPRVTTEPLGPLLAPEEALRRVALRRERVASFRARAGLAVTIDGESLSSDAALVAARPASIRLETLSLIGPTLILAIDGDRLTAYTSTDERFFRGTVASADRPFTPSLVLPPLPAESLLDALLATPLATAEGLVARLDESTHAFVVDVPAGTGVGRRRLRIDPTTGAPLALDELDPDGSIRYHATWEGADEPVPRALLLEVPRYGLTLSITVPRAELAPKLAAGLFQLSPPRGATIVDLDAVAPAGEDATTETPANEPAPPGE